MTPPACESCGCERGAARAHEFGAVLCARCYFERGHHAAPPELALSTSNSDSSEIPQEMSGPPPLDERHLWGESDISREPAGKQGVRAADDWTARRAAALGIPPPGKSGPCVIPGHDHRAALVPDGNKHWNYLCPEAGAFGLAEVRAILGWASARRDDRADARRDIRRPGKVELSRWAELLDFEAGLAEPREEIPVTFPPDLSPSARAAASALSLFLRLRDSTIWGEQDFTFSRTFCRARTGLSEGQAKQAIQELVARRVIVRTGIAKGRAYQYRCGHRDEVA
jgi:hypothetical protein